MKEEGETLKKKACEKTEQETEALKALAQGKEEEAVSAVMKRCLMIREEKKPEKEEKEGCSYGSIADAANQYLRIKA